MMLGLSIMTCPWSGHNDALVGDLLGCGDGVDLVERAAGDLDRAAAPDDLGDFEMTLCASLRLPRTCTSHRHSVGMC